MSKYKSKYSKKESTIYASDGVKDVEGDLTGINNLTIDGATTLGGAVTISGSLTLTSGKQVTGIKRQVTALTDLGAAGRHTALTAQDSGKIITIPELTTGTQVIGLPSASKASTVGTTYTFVMLDTADQVFMISCSHGETITGTVPKGDGDNAEIAKPSHGIAFDTDAVIGSQISVTCVKQSTFTSNPTGIPRCNRWKS